MFFAWLYVVGCLIVLVSVAQFNANQERRNRESDRG